MSTQAKIEKMLKKSEVILAAGGEKRVAKQHEAGKMTARERIAAPVSYTHLTLPTKA